jgi:competence protein ComEC
MSFLKITDIGSDVEEKLILAGNNLRADVLKIPHHGSRHSNSYEFLAAVQPKIAVLSVGKGILGIPSHEALKRYDVLSIPVLRTDRDGMITVWRNKDGIVYSTQEK